MLKDFLQKLQASYVCLRKLDVALSGRYGFVLTALKTRVKCLVYMERIEQILNSCLFFYFNIP